MLSWRLLAGQIIKGLKMNKLLRDAFIVGLFFGLLVSMLALTLTAKEPQCQVTMTYPNETHILIGVTQ